MNQKQIGTILIIIGVLLTLSIYLSKSKEDALIEKIVDEMGGSCFLEDGTCLHKDRDITFYIIGWIISGVLVTFGLYISFIDKTQQFLTDHQVKVSEALKDASKKDEFSAFISGFTNDEQKILKAVKEQDGIKQSTLRYRTGLSKTTLSLILKSLEERDIITKKPVGKTNEIYLRKRF